MPRGPRRNQTNVTAEQLAAMLRRRLPHHLPGTRLPGARELARQFGVTEHTAKRAMELLTADGLVTPQKRGGHFVSEQGGQAVSLREVVAVVHPVHSRNVHVQSILVGIDEGCHRQGLRFSQDTTAFDDDLSELVQHKRMDDLVRRPGIGLLVASDTPQTPLLNHWLRLALPLVLVDATPPPGLLVNCVTSDHEGAVFSAAERLIQLGHRRIAYLGPLMEESGLLQARVRGYRMAHLASGMQPEPQLLWTGTECESGPEASRHLDEMLHRLRPTAVVCGNQRIGVAALAACGRLGLAVPGEVSVLAVGVARRELVGSVGNLSRFDQGRPEDLGRHSVELLVEFDAQRRPTHLFHQAEWLDRGSVGPPRE